MIVVLVNNVVLVTEFAFGHRRANVLGAYSSHLVSSVVGLSSLGFLGSASCPTSTWARTPTHVPPLP